MAGLRLRRPPLAEPASEGRECGGGDLFGLTARQLTGRRRDPDDELVHPARRGLAPGPPRWGEQSPHVGGEVDGKLVPFANREPVGECGQDRSQRQARRVRVDVCDTFVELLVCFSTLNDTDQAVLGGSGQPSSERTMGSCRPQLFSSASSLQGQHEMHF